MYVPLTDAQAQTITKMADIGFQLIYIHLVRETWPTSCQRILLEKIKITDFTSLSSIYLLHFVYVILDTYVVDLLCKKGLNTLFSKYK